MAQVSEGSRSVSGRRTVGRFLPSVLVACLLLTVFGCAASQYAPENTTEDGERVDARAEDRDRIANDELVTDYEFDKTAVGLSGIADSATASLKSTGQIIGKARLVNLAKDKNGRVYAVVRETHFDLRANQVFSSESYYSSGPSGSKVREANTTGTKIVEVFASWPMVLGP